MKNGKPMSAESRDFVERFRVDGAVEVDAVAEDVEEEGIEVMIVVVLEAEKNIGGRSRLAGERPRPNLVEPERVEDGDKPRQEGDDKNSGSRTQDIPRAVAFA